MAPLAVRPWALPRVLGPWRGTGRIFGREVSWNLEVSPFTNRPLAKWRMSLLVRREMEGPPCGLATVGFFRLATVKVMIGAVDSGYFGAAVTVEWSDVPPNE
jgi:hypothetical protein